MRIKLLIKVRSLRPSLLSYFSVLRISTLSLFALYSCLRIKAFILPWAVCLITFFFVTASRRRLSEYIEHYEGLDYDPDKLHQQHLRARRSIDPPADLSLKFDAHGRKFHLRLRRDLAAFSEDFKVSRYTVFLYVYTYFSQCIQVTHYVFVFVRLKAHKGSYMTSTHHTFITGSWPVSVLWFLLNTLFY